MYQSLEEGRISGRKWDRDKVNSACLWLILRFLRLHVIPACDGH